MNFSQKLVLFILIIISACYICSLFMGNSSILSNFTKQEKQSMFNPKENTENWIPAENKSKTIQTKTVKIFILDKNANIRSVNRECKTNGSCFEYAIKELLKAPSEWEKSKGFSSEIPLGTKIISVREGSNCIMLDLTPAFEMGGGTESVSIRLKQLIKTAKANSPLPVYLYLNGKQANVIGGEGLMIKQPLNERSIDE